MSLVGLSDRDFDATLLSIGSHKVARPLSPIEVARNCRRAEEAGTSVKQIATAFGLRGPTMVSRFLNLLKIDPNLLHLVDWGESKFSVIGFSTASEVLLRLPPSIQVEMANAVCQFALSKKEAKSVQQLYERSGRSLSACVQDVIGRRSVVIVRELVIGAVTDKELIALLDGMLQSERDALLKDAVVRQYPNIGEFTGKMGSARFTIIGDSSVKIAVGSDPNFESRLTSALAAGVENG